MYCFYLFYCVNDYLVYVFIYIYIYIYIYDLFVQMCFTCYSTVSAPLAVVGITGAPWHQACRDGERGGVAPGTSTGGREVIPNRCK